MATIKDVARAAGVSTATVSAVVNDTAFVSADLRARVLAAVKDLHYAPSLAARNLRNGRSQLIGMVVSDLANPFFARVVLAAEAAVAAWGYSLVIFNSDEKPDAEKRILNRIRMLSCDGAVVVPVGDSTQHLQRDIEGKPMPIVLFGRMVQEEKSDSVTIDNVSAGSAVVKARPSTTSSISATPASARSPAPCTSPPGAGASMACWRRCRRVASPPSRATSAPANSARTPPIRWRAAFSSSPTGRRRSMSPTA